MGGCSLDDQELEALQAERLASSAAASTSAWPHDRQLPLSWRASKAAGPDCGKAACACKEGVGALAAAPAARRTCGKCKQTLAQVGGGWLPCCAGLRAVVGPFANGGTADTPPERTPPQVASRQGDALCAGCLWEVTHAKVSGRDSHCCACCGGALPVVEPG